MVKTWIMIIFSVVVLGFIFLTVDFIKHKKKNLDFDFWESFGVCFGMPLFFLVSFWFIWMPIVDFFNYPHSCHIEQYRAEHPVAFYRNYTGPNKPIIEESLGERKVCLSLLFGVRRETILKKAVPAKYCEVTTCCDGTCSYSTGRGTCSWHRGVCH